MCTRSVDRKYAVLLAAALAVVGAPDFARAQGYPSKFDLGVSASAQDVAAVAIAIAPDGKGLPAGKGDYAGGKKVYETACAACHGADLQGAEHAVRRGTAADRGPRNAHHQEPGEDC